MTGQPTSAAKASTPAAVGRPPSAGTGCPARRAAPASRACPGRRRGPRAAGGAGPRSPRARRGPPVGTCSWSKVTTSQCWAKSRTAPDVGVVPDRRRGDDERGRGDVGLGEDAEGEAQLGGRTGTHPGELAAADDADDGEAPGGSGRRGHPARISGPRLYDARVPSPLTDLLDRLRGAITVLYREMIKFGVVGAAAFVIDLGGANLLWHTVLPHKVTTAKIISGAVATAFAWAGNRQWTFRHRRSRPVHHELFLFFLVNGIALGDLRRRPRLLALLARLHEHAGGQHRLDPRDRARHALPVLGLPPLRLRRGADRGAAGAAAAGLAASVCRRGGIPVRPQSSASDRKRAKTAGWALMSSSRPPLDSARSRARVRPRPEPVEETDRSKMCGAMAAGRRRPGRSPRRRPRARSAGRRPRPSRGRGRGSSRGASRGSGRAPPASSGPAGLARRGRGRSGGRARRRAATPAGGRRAPSRG